MKIRIDAREYVERIAGPQMELALTELDAALMECGYTVEERAAVLEDHRRTMTAKWQAESARLDEFIRDVKRERLRVVN